MASEHIPIDLDENINRRAVPALKVHPRVLGDGGDNLFAGSVADMDYAAAPAVRAALQKRLEHGVFGYEAVPEGLFPALTDWLRIRHDWNVDPNHILRAPNVLNTLATATALFTEEGDKVIVQPPVFFDFFDIIRENHRQLICNPLVLEKQGYRMDYEDLERKAADPKVKMMFLCSPHNPVGRVWRRQELIEVGDICARHDVLVVSDEIHADIVFNGNKHTPFASLGSDYARNSITCVSPAKSFNIAACCSAFAIVADEKMRRAIEVENSRLTVNKNNAFANAAMEAAYRNGAPWLDHVLDYLEKNIGLVSARVDHMNGVELIKPEGTFLLWLDFRNLGLTPDELTLFLRQKAKWVVTRGPAFGAQGTGFARVNIACTHARLDAALDGLADAIASNADG